MSRRHYQPDPDRAPREPGTASERTAAHAQADLNAKQRQALAFQLRLEGYDFETIAERCGYTNKSAAHKAWKVALSHIPQRSIEEMREMIFAQEMRALVAMSARIAKGDTFAVAEMTKLHDRMAHLFGLDTPVEQGAVAGQVLVRRYDAEVDAV